MRDGTRLALALVVAVLAVAIAAGIGAGAERGATADACAGVENDTILATPPGDEPVGPGGTVSVYAGSEVVVHRCQQANGTRTFRTEGISWATVVHRSDRTLRLRVASAPDESLGALAASGTVPGPELRIVGRSVQTDLVEAPIPVQSEAQASALVEAEAELLDRERTLERRLTALATATAAVENGSEPNATAVRRVLAAHQSYRNATDAVRGELYAVAESPVGGARASSAIVALEARGDEVENRTRLGLEAHGDALGDRERSATWALRLRVVGIGLLGVAIGAVFGAIVPTRRGRAARRRLAAGDWTTYSRRAAVLPAIAGIVLLVVGVGWLLSNVGGALAEVLLP